MSGRLSIVSVVAALSLVACNNGAGNDVVLRIVAELAGPRCANGGVAVQTGFDQNSNQVLDDAEVNADQTKYVCNGAPGGAGMTGPAGEPGDAGTPGLNALSEVTAEPAGSNCTYGGVRIDVGIDRNADGELDSTETTRTRYVCDRASVDSVYFGDLTIRTMADLALLDGIKVVAGTLTIEALPGGVVAFPTLEVVSNQIVFTSRDAGQGPVSDAVTTASFPELRRAGELNARFNTLLTSIGAPKLERLTRLDLSYLGALTTVSLPKLAVVEDLYLTSNPLLTALDLPALKSALSLQVTSHALLGTLTTPLLTELKSYVSITDNPVLPVCAAYRVVKGITSTNFTWSVFNNDQTATCTGADLCATRTVVGIADPIARCLRAEIFADARALCASLGSGAALAWVTSDSEWAALSNAVSSGQLLGGWLGYTDAALEGTWVTVSGFTGYTPTLRTDFWSAGEPSDTMAVENFVELTYAGLAADRDATYTATPICRVP